MNTVLVVNPAAGSGRARRVWHRLRARLDELGAWSCVWTERPGHAIELARSAAAAGARRVVAVGGDGTVSEVANGLAATGVSLAVIPAGAGNDFSRSIGIPTNPLAAARCECRDKSGTAGWVKSG